MSVSSSHIQADADCGGPSISADGRYVTFSSASDYLAGPDINPQSAVFIHDRVTGQTRLVSRATGDTPAVGSSNSASISADGRYVAFESSARNLSPEGAPGVFVRDVIAHTTRLVSVSSAGVPGDNGGGHQPMISADGRFVAYDSFADNLVPATPTTAGTSSSPGRSTERSARIIDA